MHKPRAFSNYAGKALGVIELKCGEPSHSFLDAMNVQFYPALSLKIVMPNYSNCVLA